MTLYLMFLDLILVLVLRVLVQLVLVLINSDGSDGHSHEVPGDESLSSNGLGPYNLSSCVLSHVLAVLVLGVICLIVLE